MRLLLSYELLQNYPESLFKDVLDYNSNLWKILDLNTENNCGISRIILYNAIQNYNNFNNKHDDILLMVKYFLFFYLLFL